MCEQVREAAAVRLLTGEAPDPEVDAHWAECPACAEEIARLTPLPGLLAMAAGQVELMDEPAPGEALLERLLWAASAENRRRRFRVVALAAAGVAAAALVAVPVAITVTHSSNPPAVAIQGPHPVQASATNASTGVWGQVTLARSSWGSAMTLRVTGVHAGTSCTVVVVTKDGTRQTAATWWAEKYPGPATVNGTVAADVPTISHVDLVDTASGKLLLTVPVGT